MIILTLVRAIMFRKKSDFVITLILLMLTGTLISTTYFYAYNATDYVLHNKLHQVLPEAKVEIYRLNISDVITTIPQEKVSQYIFSKYENIISEVYNVTEGFADATFTVYHQSGDYTSTEHCTTTILSMDDRNLPQNLKALIAFDKAPSLLNETEALVRSDSEYLTYFDHKTDAIGSTLELTFNLLNGTKKTYTLHITGFFTVKTSLERGDFFHHKSEILPQILINLHILSEVHKEWTQMKQTIWITFNKSSLTSENLEKFKQNLHTFAADISTTFDPFVRVKLPILDAITNFEEWYSFESVNYFAYIIPALLVGWVITKFQYEISGMQRRRKIATLKSRGISNIEIIFAIIIECLFYSIIVLVPATIIGDKLSLYYLNIQGIPVGESNGEIYSTLAHTFSNPFYMAALFITLFVLNIVSLAPNTIKSLSHEIVEARTYTAMGFEKIKISQVEKIIFLTYMPLSLYVLFIFDVFNQKYLFLLALIYLFFVANIAMKVFVNFLAKLEYKFANIIAKNVDAVSAILTTANLKQRTKVTGYSLAILILTLSFSLIVSASHVMLVTHAHDVAYYYTGADISFKISEQYHNKVEEILNITRGIEGVKNASLVRVFDGEIFLRNDFSENYYIRVIAIDSSFLECAFIKDYFLRKSSIAEVISNENKALASYGLKQDISSSESYSIHIILEYLKTAKINVRITDYVRYFPRIKFGSVMQFIVVNEEKVQDISYKYSQNYIYVALEIKVNITKVASDIVTQFKDAIHDIRVAKSIYNNTLLYSNNLLTFGFLDMIQFFMIIYLSFGLFVITLSKVERHRKEYAILRAIGFRRTQFLMLFVFDIAVTFVIITVVSVVISLIITYVLSASALIVRYLDLTLLIGEPNIINNVFAGIFYIEIILPVEYIIPIYTWLSIIVLILLVLWSTIFPSILYIKELTISYELKFEFG